MTTFTPADTTDYKSTTATVNLQVNQVTPAVSWATPAAISVGTALSLDAVERDRQRTGQL